MNCVGMYHYLLYLINVDDRGGHHLGHLEHLHARLPAAKLNELHELNMKKKQQKWPVAQQKKTGLSKERTGG
jgi:hypothetical protein